MPVYVYRNLNTHETFEVEQRITEDAWTRHPESGDPVKRLVQPVGIAFKGSGFYVTDARGKTKPAANGSAGGATEGGAKESGSSEKRDAGATGGGKEAAKSDAGSGSGTAAAKKSSAVD